ncbi:MAG: hypothetical protein JXR46_07880 [Calditrichaceae bacterium]|nr:hypothetical protein [Calditrichaceae bacterium]MBN2708947.1 hypothetical protein [Calditrichaceae bacterium]RQV97530.1 MAG: hypothetical protein EH224_00480 [Calditrichota bacterium]
MEKLINKEVYIMISDPWEFGSHFGCGPFKCIIKSTKDNKILLQLFEAIEYNKTTIEFLIAQSRYGFDIYDELIKEKNPVTSFTRISKSAYESSNPFDLSSWRGGLAFLGTLHLKKPK